MINEEALKSLERLHQLKNDGVITEEDFERAKGKLLGATSTSAKHAEAPIPAAANFSRDKVLAPFDGTLPHESDTFGWMLLPLRRYADFNGRSCRKEFWMFILLFAAFLLGVGFIGFMDSGDGSLGALSTLLLVLGLLGTLVPSIAVQVRRMHDQNKSGWFVLFNLLPYVGGVVMIVFMLLEGTHGDNRFGPDPIERP